MEATIESRIEYLERTVQDLNRQVSLLNKYILELDQKEQQKNIN